jgi:hypothetical protein
MNTSQDKSAQNSGQIPTETLQNDAVPELSPDATPLEQEIIGLIKQCDEPIADYSQAQAVRILPHSTKSVDPIDLPPVRFYTVIGKDINNKSHFLSSMLATPEQAREFSVCSEQYQHVCIQVNTVYFLTYEEADRRALLAQIVTDASITPTVNTEYAIQQA